MSTSFKRKKGKYRCTRVQVENYIDQVVLATLTDSKLNIQWLDKDANVVFIEPNVTRDRICLNCGRKFLSKFKSFELVFALIPYNEGSSF